MKKYINENFFDKESKAMYYILGVAYPCYIPNTIHEGGMIFRFNNKNLAEIVKEHFESEHKITQDTKGRSSYFFGVRNKYMSSRMKLLGLVDKKSERKFPKRIKEKYLDHFIRGFFDGQAIIYRHNNNAELNRISLYFNHYFLSDLNKILNKYASANNRENIIDHICYGHVDSIKIHDFIYRDLDFIKINNLFLKSKRSLFNVNYEIKPPVGPRSIKVQNDVKRTKTLLLEGKLYPHIAKSLGYIYPEVLFQSFKRHTGMTIREFLRSNNVIKRDKRDYSKSQHAINAHEKFEKAKMFLLNGKKISEFYKDLGYKSLSGVYYLFKRYAGKGVKEFSDEYGF